MSVRLGRWLLAAHLLSAAGCLCCLNSVSPPSAETLETCHAVPCLGRNHVYIFFLGSLDPLDCANLSGVRDYLHKLGFIKTYYGQVYHVCWFKSEMRRIHKEDPAARFVLVGHGVGANTAHALAGELQEDDIDIDLLVYVDGTRLDKRCRQPKNVSKIIHVSGTYCLSPKKNLRDVENIHLQKAGCFGAATHPQTLDVLAEELTQVAARVPVTLPPDPRQLPSPEEQAPTPRPVVPPAAAARDEWDFLKPVASLSHRSPSVGSPDDPVQATKQNASPHSVLKPKEVGP